MQNPPKHFMSALAARLLSDAFTVHTDNFDGLRFPELPNGEIQSPIDRQAALDTFYWIGELDEQLEMTYQLLGDNYSKNTLVEVMAYRTLGAQHTKLSRNNAAYQKAVNDLPSLQTAAKTMPVALLDGWLNRYALNPIGFPIHADLHPLNVLYTYQLQQYRYDHDGTIVEAMNSDIAIDGGGCWGDTALYLAHKIGPAGKVYCFEFSPDNLPPLEKNLSANPTLQSRIQIQRNALWSKSDESLSFNPAGPGTRVGNAGGSFTVKTLNIDDLVSREKLSQVNFIKMDIEGAELDSLKGAEQTIRKYKPRLAVTLYHHLRDFVTIPKYLNDLNLGYKFYMDHFSINQEETVLFATV